jgi:hypothetical protein
MFSLFFARRAPYRLSQVQTAAPVLSHAVSLRVFAFQMIDTRSLA